MTTSAVDPYAFLNGTKSTTQDAKSNQELGQNEFLKLMLAQLKNQDPMKPTDPTQFLSQLAQFSQVTGIQNMQTSMQDLAASLRSTADSQRSWQPVLRSSFIGRPLITSSGLSQAIATVATMHWSL